MGAVVALAAVGILALVVVAPFARFVWPVLLDRYSALVLPLVGLTVAVFAARLVRALATG